MDIVAALWAGRITPDAAEQLLIDRIASWAGAPDDVDGFVAHVGMSVSEYTAYAHGATISDIGRLRAQGWPDRCASCARGIDYDAGFWFHTPERVNCVRCPDHPAADTVPWNQA